MDVRLLQSLMATLALVFLPWPAFRPFEYSLTYGDLFLTAAVLLNADQLFRLQPFQIPFLIAFPFIVFSQVADPDGGIIEILQTLYIFGFLLPFASVAFCRMAPARFLGIFLGAQALSSFVALMQASGLMGTVGQQLLWETRDATRAAGFNVSCSGLCMNLTSLFCFLRYLPSYRWRVVIFCVLLLGMSATIAKSAIFALPAIAYYLWTEPNRQQVLRGLGGVGLLAIGYWAVSSDMQLRVLNLLDSIVYRVDNVDFSVWERMSTLNFALQLVSDCYVLGLGYNGTHLTMTQHLGNTVHVYHVGLVLIGGLICAIFHYWGVILLCRDALNRHLTAVPVAVVGHCLSVCTMTVLMHSFQYTPYILCAALVHYTQAQTDSQQRAVSIKRQ